MDGAAFHVFIITIINYTNSFPQLISKITIVPTPKWHYLAYNLLLTSIWLNEINAKNKKKIKSMQVKDAV